jgi:iron-sulfur cluster repair protein YtfE (RIC family)
MTNIIPDNLSISFLMFEHHQRLNKLLDKLIDPWGIDKETYQKTWSDFVGALEAHIQGEERAIFSYDQLGDQGVANIIRQLMGEHAQIRELIARISSGAKTIGPDLIEMRDLLYKHESLECDQLYPKLDRELKEAEKQKIIDNLH